MQQPPLLPEETLARVLRVARFDGMSALVLGSVFAVLAASAGDMPFAAVGLLAAGAGAIELHGIALLQRVQPRGMNWLIASQPFLLLVILSYCALRLTYVELPPVPEQLRPLIDSTAERLNRTPEQYLMLVNRLTAATVAVVAVLYQGGMTLYYTRRRAAVTRALTEEVE